MMNDEHDAMMMMLGGDYDANNDAVDGNHYVDDKDDNVNDFIKTNKMAMLMMVVLVTYDDDNYL